MAGDEADDKQDYEADDAHASATEIEAASATAGGVAAVLYVVTHATGRPVHRQFPSLSKLCL